MRRKLLFLFALFLPFIVNASTKTYNICKEGCEYDSILVVWHDIYKLTEDTDVVINFKDDGVYTFFDMNHFDVIMEMDEDEQAAHITNPHVKSVVINGDKDNNTTIDVINIPQDYIRQAFTSSDIFSEEELYNFYKILVEADLRERFIEENDSIIKEIDEYTWQQIKSLKKELTELNKLDKSLVIYNKDGKRFTFGEIINSLNTYDDEIPYYDFYYSLEAEFSYLLAIGWGRYLNDDMCGNDDMSPDCEDLRNIYNIWGDIELALDSFFPTQYVEYNNVDMDSLIEDKKKAFLDGTDDLIVKAFNMFYGSSDDTAITVFDKWGYMYLCISADNLDSTLDESKSMMLRLMFTGIVNTDFEINNINYIGSPFFASSGDKVTGTINNSKLPYLLLVGGNVDVYVKNSKLNRIYSVGIDDFNGETICTEIGGCITLPYECDGTNLCGNSNVYINKTDEFYNKVRRFDLSEITSVYDDVFDAFKDISEVVSKSDVPTDLVNFVEEHNGVFTEDDYPVFNKRYVVEGEYFYDAQEKKYYKILENDAETLMSLYAFVVEDVKEYFRDSLMAEISGGKIYFMTEESVDLYAKDNMSLKDIFKDVDIDFDKLEWSIADPSIVKIVDGKVLGIKKGTTEITAIYGRDVYKLIVNVNEVPENPNTKTMSIVVIAALLLISSFVLIFMKINKIYLVK